MADGGLTRSQYFNLSTGAPRQGATAHGESFVDMDTYLSRLEQARNAAVFDWGVADGLVVRAVANQAGLTVTPGTALDATGRLIVLAVDGVAVVDPTVDPAQMVNVPTELVPEAGLSLATDAHSGGDLLLTLTCREVQVVGILDNAPVLQHAPWLRLVPAEGFADIGSQVVLAAVSVAADGTVSSLAVGPRRRVGLPAGRLRLVIPEQLPGIAAELSVGEQALAERMSAELAALPQGGLAVTVPGPAGPRTALTVDGATSQVSVPDLTVGSLGAGSVTADSLTARSLTAKFSKADSLTAGFVTAESVEITNDLSADTLDTSKVSSSVVVADTVSAVTSMLRDSGEAMFFHTSVGSDGAWRLSDSRKGERLTVDASGQLSMALPPDTPAQRIIHVEGGEIHSGGGAGGFSFSDRSKGAFVNFPGSGERWVWYALDGRARLWSGTKGDILSLSLLQIRPPLIIGTPLLSVNGDLHVTGTISKGGGGFRIDHPLDPQHRYLNHSFVESPDMATLYSGTARTGEDGLAEVELPDYFSALNVDVRVHLTAVSSLSAVTVASPIEGNRFTVRSAEPSVTVNWLVTGVRDDAWARAHRIVVEEDKPEDERGGYLHPDAFGDQAQAEQVSGHGTGGGE